MNLRRWAALVEYQGTNYYGWQTQEIEGKSVQPWVESALSYVANEPIQVTCAGRTDTGVHATAQVIHFDTQAERTGRAFVMGGNTKLPDDVGLVWAHPVPEDFSARFTARWRRYHYVIRCSPTRPGVNYQNLTHVHRELDVREMARAAQLLEGTQDFSALRSKHCQAPNPIREMHFVRLYRCQEWLVIDVQANAFLHHMVRNIAGSLIAIGKGDRDAAWLQSVLDSKDRAKAGITAPASGLHLCGVGYQQGVDLPETLRFPPVSMGIVRPDWRVFPL